MDPLRATGPDLARLRPGIERARVGRGNCVGIGARAGPSLDLGIGGRVSLEPGTGRVIHVPLLQVLELFTLLLWLQWCAIGPGLGMAAVQVWSIPARWRMSLRGLAAMGRGQAHTARAATAETEPAADRG